MSESQSLAGSFFALLRRRFVTFSLIAVCSFALVPIFFAAVAILIYSQPGAGQESPKVLWDGANGWVKTASILILLLTFNLPRDLTEAGVSLVAWTEQRGEVLAFRSVIARMAQMLPRLVPLSLVLGFLVVLLGPTLLLPVALGIVFALVMPLVGTTRLGGIRALKMGFKLSMRGFLQILALYLATLAVLLPAAFAFILVFRMIPQFTDSVFAMQAWLGVALVFLAVFYMLRSVLLALIYLRVLRESALEFAAEGTFEPKQEGLRFQDSDSRSG